jgi:diguanylate cyclase
MIVLLAGSSLANAMAAAEKMRKAVEEFQIADRDKTYNVTVSFGVSAFRPGDSVESVIRRSDEGLYKSKLAGRNRVSTVEEL